MTLKELIAGNTWETIPSKFIALYPSAKNEMEAYKKMFESLKTVEPEKIGMTIVITKEKDIIDGEDFIDVAGIVNTPTNMEENYSHGIELLPWRQWLGMDISKDSLANFNAEEIIIHCLYEMTFEGFSGAEKKIRP